MKTTSSDSTQPGGDRSTEPAATLPRIFLTGEVISGRFEIHDFLGQGGMGQVFSAYDRELETRVALKVVRPDRGDYEDLAQRFKVEVEIARRVTHPHVCRVFDLFSVEPSNTDWGQAGGHLMLLTMELIEGETLFSHLRRNGATGLEESTPWIVQMASALDAAHRAGVAHRDFKSSNVVLRETEQEVEAVVTDFGLARSTGSSDGGSGFEGTLAYAAPEVRGGAEGDVRSDVYSFGAVVHELLTGQQFDPSDPESLIQRDLPSEVRVALRRCLATDPDTRFASAGKAAEALTQPKLRRRIAIPLLAIGLVLGGLIWAVSRNSAPDAEAKRWRRAEQIYHEQQRFSEGDLGIGLRQVEALADAGDTRAALAKVEKLRTADQSTQSRVALDLAEARISERASDYEAQLDAARAITQRSAPASDQSGVLNRARAGILEASALYQLGELEEAAAIAADALATLATHGDEWSRAQVTLTLDLDFLEEYELIEVPEALSIFQTLGDTESEARLQIADARRRVGNQPAEELLPGVEEALALARSIPSLRAEAEALNTKAMLTWAQGDGDAAVRIYREAVRAAELSGDPNLIAGYSMNLALMLQHYGRSTEIDERLAQAVTIFRRLGSRRGLSLALANTARNYRYKKLYPEAEQFTREALAEARLSGDRGLIHNTLELMTLILIAQERYADARSRTMEALEIAQTASEIEWDRLRLARIDWQEGKTTDAIEALRTIADRNPLAAEDASLAISCRLDLTRALADAQRFEDAAAVLQEVIPFTLDSSSKAIRRSTGRLAARLHRQVEPLSPFPRIFEEELHRAERDGRLDDYALATLEQASFYRQLELGTEACRSLVRGIERTADQVEPVLLERLQKSHRRCLPSAEPVG